MKKAFKINLGGQIFHIDEDAYEKLRVYLDTISSHFSNIEESREIINDIENRLAELLLEQVSTKDQVVTLADVEKVIGIMGKPEEIADEEGNGKASGAHAGNGKRSRRLYRDPDRAAVAGVASGLAAYFDIDVVIIRILFVVFTLVGWGFALLAYIVLWIAVPKANTAAEKLEMRGEKVNVSNLEKKIREEYEDTKENLKRVRNSESAKNAENFLEKMLHVIGVIFMAFLKIIAAFVAVILVIVGVSLIASLLGVAFGASFIPFGLFHSHSLDFGELMLPFINPTNLGVIAVAATLVILIPMLTIIYGLFKALFRFKAKDRGLGMSAFALWIIALITTISLVAFEARNYSDGDEITETLNLADIQSNTLFVKMSADDPGKEEEHKLKLNDRWYVLSKGDKIYGEVEIDIEKSRTSAFELRIEKGSRGYDQGNARELAEKISYHYTLSDSLLVLDRYFSSEADDRWRLQNVEITILVPENYQVDLDKSTSHYLEGVFNLDDYSNYQMGGKRWIMREEGLEFVRNGKE